MARGKPWTKQEKDLLVEMANQGLAPQQIYDSGKLPGRTFRAIGKQLKTIAYTKPTATVHTIVPSQDIVSLEEVLKRFSTAFKQICEMREVDKLAIERFRIIFGAAKDYAPLLANYERLSTVEEEIKNLRKMVEEIKAQIPKPTGSDQK